MTNTERLLDQLVEEVYPQLREKFGAGNCILASKAAIEFLRMNNVPAFPIVAETHVMNDTWMNALQLPDVNEEMMKQAVANGAHCVAVVEDQPDSPRKGYKGHLVVIVNREFIVDLSLDQANRPAKDIQADPFWLEMPRLELTSFLRGRTAFTACQVHDGNNTWITYRLQPKRKDFETAPDWVLPEFRFTTR
jgi:hypothetical protein